ncbi:hypothetical protein [Gilliamella sp. Occ3-1]|uniref:hypothetical protein n=1 Tax=Gilliamella sp. Occ3-1 TaxID=3120253 RepID=UPI00114743E9|nr:hypothetical protein [Gilliamella apicola]
MKNHLTCYPVTRICSLLGVSSSGYNAWLKRANKSAKLSEYIQKSSIGNIKPVWVRQACFMMQGKRAIKFQKGQLAVFCNNGDYLV